MMAAVDLFYQKVTDDELTRPFFKDLDMKAQATKQVAFMTWAFGGAETAEVLTTKATAAKATAAKAAAAKAPLETTLEAAGEPAG